MSAPAGMEPYIAAKEVLERIARDRHFGDRDYARHDIVDAAYARRLDAWGTQAGSPMYPVSARAWSGQGFLTDDGTLENSEFVAPWSNVQFRRDQVERLWPGLLTQDNAEPMPQPEPSKAHRNAGGRPEKYDWWSFAVEVARRANTPDGLPERHILTRDMTDWCATHWAEEPAPSLLRDRIADFYKT